MNDIFDDYEFTPSASSNLASLFDSPTQSPENSSLIYTAPKQPKTQIDSTEVKSEPPKPESSVICARVVQVWKLVENKYIAIGKHGLAVIGSTIQNTYEVILYREKRNVIVRIKISNNFEVSLKKDDFISFYDSLKENWLIKFNNTEDCTVILNYIENFSGKIIKATETKQNDKEVSHKSESPENKAKADILSRIAKMGQSILPNKNLDTDIYTEEENKIDDSASMSSTDTKMYDDHSLYTPTTTTNIVQVPRTFQQIPNTVVIGQTMAYDPLNMYIAENRTQSSEVRMNLSQINEKLNHILNVVHSEKPSNDGNEALKSKIKVLDLRVENLLKELRSYQEENEKLKIKFNEQEGKLIAENENRMKLIHSKEEETIKILSLEQEIVGSKNTIKELSDKIEEQRIEIENLNTQLEASQNDKKLENDIIDLNNTISDLKMQISNFEEEKNCMKSDQETEEKMQNFIPLLKELMNGMYGNIMGHFNEDKEYKTSEINSIIAQNIKSTTLKIIQNYQDICKK